MRSITKVLMAGTGEFALLAGGTNSKGRHYDKFHA